MQEVWKDIPFNSSYMVSNMGNVYSKGRYVDGKLGSKRYITGRLLKPYESKDGYLKVDISRNVHLVHRLVAMVFIENSLGKKEVNHKDRNRQNNCVDNLEWVTLQENQKHSWENGRAGCMLGRSGFLHNKSNPICVYKFGNRVCVYGSIKEAARELGVVDSVIGQSIKRGTPVSKKSHKLYGYHFEKI